MLYAPISSMAWKEMADEWEVVTNAYKFLQKYTQKYQLVMERSVLGGGVAHRCVLVRWDVDATFARRREVVMQTLDPKHAELVLSVLISEAKHDSQR